MQKILKSRIERLIRFQSTVNHHAEQRACAEWILRELQQNITDRHVRVRLMKHNNVYSVVAIRGRWKQPDVLLNGHFDVVNGTPEQFIPTSGGDRIYGRGAADMKGGIAAFITTCIHVIKNHPHLSIGLLLTGDEEIGGANGAAWFAAQGWKPKLILNFDGGYAEQLTHAEKGILRIRITAHGKTALSSYRWQGASPIEKILAADNILQSLFPDSLRATAENNWFTTYALTEFISQNENLKTIPDTATAVASIHFVEDISAERLLKNIRKHLPRDIHIEPIISAERVWMRADHPQIKRFQKIYAGELGHTPRIRGENGSSDARFFTHLHIPIIITKPLGGNPELDNEWVSLKSVEKLTRATIEFLKTYK